jgi:hypothetical protein
MIDRVNNETINDGETALAAFLRTWPYFVNEAQEVLGSELLYQAIFYHCLRTRGEVPIRQLGMNVKMHIDEVVSVHFKSKANPLYSNGCESVPDILIGRPELGADFRRRNYKNTHRNALLAAEMKVSENDGKRMHPGPVLEDIAKIAAIREEALHRDSDIVPAMVVVCTAPLERERLTEYSRREVEVAARELGVCYFYVGPDDDSVFVPDQFAK